jgi:hypothetical protein
MKLALRQEGAEKPARGTTGSAGGTPALEHLAQALERETELAVELRDTLRRQRAAVATCAVEAVTASVGDLQRVLLALEDAHRPRAAIVAEVTGDPSMALENLESRTGDALPPRLVTARARLREAAAEAAHEAAVNRVVLRRVVEAGEAFLQELFSSSSGPAPAYGPSDTSPPRGDPGFLLDREV